jgi:hypothetical protein
VILTIGHESEVGKDTFAMFIIEYLRTKNLRGLKIVREGFADKLYEFCHSIYGWAGFQTRQYYIVNPKHKDIILPALGKSARQILIDVGNHMRDYDLNCWLNANLKNDDAHLKLVTDLRKMNEFEHCEQHNIFRLKIWIPGKPKSEHASDKDLYAVAKERWSEWLSNDGDLQCFNQKAIEFTDRNILPTLRKYQTGELKLSNVPSLTQITPRK